MININWGNSVKRKYIDFDIQTNKPITEQLDSLKEDLIQIEYDNGYIIDVGWYPEFSENGNFIALLIKNYEWDNPLLKYQCCEIHELKKYIIEFVEIAQKD